MKDITAGAQKGFILLFGIILTALCLRDTMFITKTGIPLIIALITLAWFLVAYTCDMRVKRGLRKILSGLKNFTAKELTQQKSGIKAKRAESGISSIGKKALVRLKRYLVSVSNAAKTMKPNIHQGQSFAITTVKLKHFEQGESKVEEVFDLTIENNHEYFANGVLVHNCMDAARYANSVNPRPFFV